MRLLLNRGNVQTAKSYPHWDTFKTLAAGHDIREMTGILSQEQLFEALNWCEVWLSVDSFLQHFVAYHKINKPGVVLWALSDPLIFGYRTNTNLLKSRSCLRPDQFRWWKDQVWDPDKFVSPEAIIEALTQIETAYHGKRETH